jgi:hypothetical protein
VLTALLPGPPTAQIDRFNLDHEGVALRVAGRRLYFLTEEEARHSRRREAAGEGHHNRDLTPGGRARIQIIARGGPSRERPVMSERKRTMRDYPETKKCVLCKQVALVRRHWSKAFVVDHEPLEPGAAPVGGLEMGATDVFICRACDQLLAVGNLEALERRAFEGWKTHPDVDPDDAEQLDWLRRQTREYVAVLVASLDPPVTTPPTMSRQQRRAMDRRMAAKPSEPRILISTEFPADLPDNVRVFLDTQGTWVPPKGKGWRVESDTRDPSGKERAVLWVRDAPAGEEKAANSDEGHATPEEETT